MIWLSDLDDLEKTAHDLGSDHLMGNPRNHRKSSKFFSGRHSNSCETILHKTVRSDPSLRNPSPQKPKCMCFPGKNDGCDWCDFQKYQAVMGWILSELITVRAEDIKGRAAGRRLHVWFFLGSLASKQWINTMFLPRGVITFLLVFCSYYSAPGQYTGFMSMFIHMVDC